MVLSLLPRYVRTFGPWNGLVKFIVVEWLKSEQVSVKGLPHAFRLRRKTTDALVFREVFLFRSYDVDVDQPKVIVDGGANIGLASLDFAARHKQSTIYAIEPEGDNFEVLKKNVSPYPSIVPVQSALWNKETSLKVKSTDEHSWAFQVTECAPGTPGSFTAMSIRTLMDRYKIERIDVLKLDVEGAEKEIFSENVDQWITKTHIIIIELHDWMKEGCSRAVFGAIARYRFSTKIVNGMLVLTNLDLE